MSHRFKNCIIHIGTEKTGTSAIQQFLAQNRQAFAREGVWYPDLGHGGSQIEIVAAALPEPWKNANFVKRLRFSDQISHTAFMQKLTRDLESGFKHAVDCETLLVSSEHFHSRLVTLGSIGNLRNYLSQWSKSFQVVVYFRRQDRVAVSQYSTRIKHGGVTDIDVSSSPFGKFSRYYDYDAVFDDWAQIFGAEAMSAALYDEVAIEQNSLIRDFCSRNNMSIAGKQMPGTQNPSLNQKGLAILARINDVFPGLNSMENKAFKQLVIRGLCERYSGKFYFVDRRQAESFYALFEDVNRKLLTKAFPQKNAPLFDSDFSEYPEKVYYEELSGDEVSLLAEQVIEEANKRHLARVSPSLWKQVRSRMGL